MKSILIQCALFSSIIGCTAKYNKTVSVIDRERFMGTWYVMAGRFTAFETEPYNAIEKYSWNEKERQIDIDFTFNKGSLTGPVKKIPQTAWIYNKETNAHWKVSPFWPLKFDYLVIALDPDYQWTAIGVPNQRYLWIMARDPKFSRAQIAQILHTLDKEGYSIKDIEYVEHSQK